MRNRQSINHSPRSKQSGKSAPNGSTPTGYEAASATGIGGIAGEDAAGKLKAARQL
jgi:hypothetical protein